MFGYLSGHLQKLHWRSHHSSLLIRFLVLSSMWEVYWWNLPPPATAEVLFGVHKTRVKGLRFISCSGVNWATWFKWAISFDADRSSGAFDPCIYWMHHQRGTATVRTKNISLRTFYFVVRSLEMLCSWVPTPVSAEGDRTPWAQGMVKTLLIYQLKMFLDMLVTWK